MSRHRVAGQNPIRGEDAGHNWVRHVLIAFHLDGFGLASTAGCNSKRMLVENNKSLRGGWSQMSDRDKEEGANTSSPDFYLHTCVRTLHPWRRSV